MQIATILVSFNKSRGQPSGSCRIDRNTVLRVDYGISVGWTVIRGINGARDILWIGNNNWERDEERCINRL